MTLRPDDMRGATAPDFLAIGLGGTNMMAMLWTVAAGRRAVGVEMRGDPFLGVHWNIRVDFYHQLGLIDQLMMERYGEAGVPRRPNGAIFRLADLFYSRNTEAGDIMSDGIINGFDTVRHIAGTIQHVEFIDDRWRHGVPNRRVSLLAPPVPPDTPVPDAIRRDIGEVLAGPSTFQAGAASVLILLRRYLEAIEEMDLAREGTPRVRLFTNHRVVPSANDGFVREADGRMRVRIESLQELDFKGRFVRVRTPGTEPIDLGVPGLFMIAEGFRSTDGERLGFRQQDVTLHDEPGRSGVVAQADFLAGLVEVLVGGRLRRRIASAFDEAGREYWVRQIAVGHENDPEVGWILVQVPDFQSFDPIAAGLVPADTHPDSAEYFAAYDVLVQQYYFNQVADVLELPVQQLRGLKMAYGPKMFSLVERMGANARIAPNGVIAGDSFGNGHFLTSGGAMAGMVGHGMRMHDFWRDRDNGLTFEEAIGRLAEAIRSDTQAWLDVSATEYSDAAPINFGQERIGQIMQGSESSGRARLVDSRRRVRHSLIPLNPSDWRRPLIRAGRVFTGILPELHLLPPEFRRLRSTATPPCVLVLADDVGGATPRLLSAVAALPGARIVLVTTREGSGMLSPALQARVVAHLQVDDLHNLGAVGAALQGQPEVTCAVALGGAPALAAAMLTMAHGVTHAACTHPHALCDQPELRRRLIDAEVPVVAGNAIVDAADAFEVVAACGYFPLTLRPANACHGRQRWTVSDERELSELMGRISAGPDLPLLATRPLGDRWATCHAIVVDGVPTTCLLARHGMNARGRWAVSGTMLDPESASLQAMALAALRAIGARTGLFSVTIALGDDGARVDSVDAGEAHPGMLDVIAGAVEANAYRLVVDAVARGAMAALPVRRHVAAWWPAEAMRQAPEVFVGHEAGGVAAWLDQRAAPATQEAAITS